MSVPPPPLPACCSLAPLPPEHCAVPSSVRKSASFRPVPREREREREREIFQVRSDCGGGTSWGAWPVSPSDISSLPPSLPPRAFRFCSILLTQIAPHSHKFALVFSHVVPVEGGMREKKVDGTRRER